MENSDPNPVLPNDILLQIFHLLPARTLLQFRCVSKSWHHLISLGRCSATKNLLPPPMAGLFRKNKKGGNIQFISLDSRTYVDTQSIDTHLSFLPSDLNIADCRNGLLLLEDSNHLYLCNPATERWSEIAKPPKPSYHDIYCTRFMLDFDPKLSGSRYQIISFKNRYFPGLVVEVFSSETREWTAEIIADLREISLESARFCFLDGIIYIMEANNGGSTLAVDIKQVHCRLCFGDQLTLFGIHGKFCRLVDQPEIGSGCGECLGQSGGRLHYAVISSNELRVWALDDGLSGDGYLCKHEEILEGPGLDPSCSSVEAFHLDLDVAFLSSQGKIFAYHLPSCKLEEIV